MSCRIVLPALSCALLCLLGCGHTARTLEMRTALDEGRPRDAIASLDKELEVDKDAELPKDIQGDNALLVLDRASIQQSLNQWKLSETDFGAADKAIDMLDLAHNAGDSIGEFVFSGSVGKYQAPPYEKLLINVLNMMNYLETGDLNGARIEARRMSVMDKYLVDQLHEDNNAVLGLGSFLAGLTYEKSGDFDEGLRYYDETLRFSGFESLKEAVRTVLAEGSYTSPRLKGLAGDKPPLDPVEKTGEAELVFVIGYGRVPHKESNRIPIGLALTLFAGDIHPNDAVAANKLAAQGLVTWVNFPTMGKEQGAYAIPECQVDGSFVQLEEAVDVTQQVRAEWKKIEGKIVASAITRLVARLAVGAGIQAATKDSVVGFLASLGTQATLTALDTPDTRSWETLPARIAIARVRVPAGRHEIFLRARGVYRREPVVLEKGGWKLVSLMALR